MSDTSITCPTCKGKGQSYCHLNYGGGRGEWKWVNCLTCGGAKAITPEKQEQIEIGRRLRDRRKADPYRSLDEEAGRLALDKVELSHAEWGRLPLDRLREIEAMGEPDR